MVMAGLSEIRPFYRGFCHLCPISWRIHESKEDDILSRALAGLSVTASVSAAKSR
jgi:hypothetical protein